MTIVIDGTNGISGVDGTASNPAYEGTDSNTGLFYPAADTVGIATGGTEALRINSSQNVGIGTSSPLSTAMLEVSRSTTVIPTATVTADAQVTGWRVRRTGGTYPYEYYMGIRENSTALDFYDNTANALRARITSGGNFLIGTTTANALLSVATTNDAGYFETNSNSVALELQNGSANNTILRMSRSSNFWDLQHNNADNSFSFDYNDTERARITSGGNLLVNATAAVINSNEAIGAVALNSTSPAISAKNSAGATSACVEVWNNATSGNNLFVMFSTETAYTTRGNIDYNRGAGLVRYNTTSDATLKNIIGDSNGQKSVEILSNTRIREFAWKDDEQQKPQIGVIAQELYETYKGAVSVGGDVEKTDAEGNVTTEYRPWGVDKTAFTFHLIAGWQAHEKIIQELRAELDATKAEVAALKGTA